MDTLTVVAAANPYPFIRCTNRIVSATCVPNNAFAEVGEFILKDLIDAAVRGEKAVTAQYCLHTVSNHLPITFEVIVVRI